MIMQTPNNVITPILKKSTVHSLPAPLSGYNSTGDMGVVNSWLTPGTPYVSHEYPSALFPTDSDSKFVTRRKSNNVPLMDLNQIQQLKKITRNI